MERMPLTWQAHNRIILLKLTPADAALVVAVLILHRVGKKITVAVAAGPQLRDFPLHQRFAVFLPLLGSPCAASVVRCALFGGK